MAADTDDDDLLFLVAIGAGLFIFYNYFRFATASDASGGGFVFSGTAPNTGSPLGEMMNVLVPMTVSPQGRAMIEQQEGRSAMPYGDAGGQSVGVGHFIQPGENFVFPLSNAEIDALYSSDLARVENAINANVRVALNQDQFDAIADWVFNVGVAAFLRSTLLRVLNTGDYAGAAAQFARWNQSQGAVNPALVARRQNEQQLFSMNTGTGTPTMGTIG